jgi:hypothetical protein
MFIFPIDQELWVDEVIGHILSCDYSLGLEKNELNLIYIYISIYLQLIKSYAHVS